MLEEKLWFEQGMLERLGSFLAWDVGTLSMGYIVSIEDRTDYSRRKYEDGWKDIRVRHEAEVGKAW